MRRAALALFLAVVVVPSAEPRESKKKREAAYAAAVQSYSQKLNVGMTRVELEAYLRNQGTDFFQMCCVARNDVWDVLVKIGEERHPWYCEKHYVYVAFEFLATQPHPSWKAFDTDVLREIKRYEMYLGCL